MIHSKKYVYDSGCFCVQRIDYVLTVERLIYIMFMIEEIMYCMNNLNFKRDHKCFSCMIDRAVKRIFQQVAKAL